MSEIDRIARLKRMLGQVAPVRSNYESLSQRERPIAIEGLSEEATGIARAHEASALEKLSRNREAELTPEETFTLEAIVLPERRPVVFIRNSVYDANIDPWKHLNEMSVRARLQPLLPSIGRIEVRNAGIPYGGTGFVVGPDLLMTNRHVARLFADGLGSKIRYRPGAAAVDFLREIGLAETDDTALIEIARVEMIHPYWDMALLRVEGLDGRHAPLPLSTRAPAEFIDQDVVVVGYPARDDRNDLTVQDRVFGKKYMVKRFQPGKVRGRAGIVSFENQVDALTHDSSTLGGNSGSAVIDVESGQVIGLHFAGVYLKANYAVPAAELARDARVVKLGLTFEGAVPATQEWDHAWSTTIDELGAAAIETLKVPRIYPELGKRTGFDRHFLELDGGAPVPLPVLTAKGKAVAATMDSGETELKYHKFSIVMHGQRRLALFTAANVDWRIEQRLIKGKKPNRKKLTGLGPNDQEKWVTDQRLGEDQQLPDYFYTRDGGAFDKGHLVRRDDVVWGSSFKDMQKANGDTYHTTNCSPQVKEFNRSSEGEDNWGDLEVVVEKETGAEKAILFSGPVLQDDDPVFEGKDGKAGKIRLKIPRRFWKIILVRENGGAGAYGFMLEQDTANVPTVEEFVVPAEWRQYMAPIADVEHALNGLVDLTWLKQRDRFDSPEAVAIKKLIS